jgi:hypothetical protein
MPVMPASTKPETGDHCGRFAIKRNALNAEFVISFVRIWLSAKLMRGILKLTSTIAKGAEFVPRNVSRAV